MRIGELARISGFPSKTIRYYESIGLLPEPRRRPSGYRVYDVSHVRRLQLVRLGKAAGLSLAEIAEIIAAGAPDQANCEYAVALLGEKLAAVTIQLAELQQLHDTLEHTLEAARRQELRPSTGVDDCPVIERAALERLAASEAVLR